MSAPGVAGVDRLGPLVQKANVFFAANPKLIFGLILLLALPFLAAVVSCPLDYKGQMVFGLVALGGGWLAARRLKSRIGVIIVILISVMMSARYFYWRVTSTLGFESNTEAVLGYLLLAAEVYGLLIMLLGYFQNSWLLQRKPVSLPSDISSWPTVDIFIPTYNEPLQIVAATVLAAQMVDWPADRVKVYLLDDGRRDSFRDFALAAGVGYLTRADNRHAKAGNLNAALAQTHGEYVAIFDCDHIVARSFLQVTMGWFLKDAKLACVQTPHHFFSPDPFERNLKVHGSVPNEGEFFYGVVQDGNDYWNASFFCGSCAIIKRKPLEEVGGIAVETVTEDAHTALKLCRRGYNLAYLSIPQAAGLATDSVLAHVQQRIRWARGMAQIFRIDNPLFGSGLSLGQRLCFLNAMFGFFYSIPRLVFLLAPTAYLFFGLQIYQSYAVMVLAYALPHIVLSQIAGHRVAGPYRHSFWGEMYDTLLAPFIMLPVLVALVKPKAGGFNVTAKGATTFNRDVFDRRIATPTLLLLGINLTALVMGLVNNLYLGAGDAATASMNLVLVLLNIVLLGACLLVARESKEVRGMPRVAMVLPAAVYLPNGRTVACQTVDFSGQGFGLKLPDGVPLESGGKLGVGIFRGEVEFNFACTVMHGGTVVGVEVDDFSIDTQRRLVQATFARADNWTTGWGQKRRASPLASLRELMGHGLFSWRNLARVLKFFKR